MRVFIRCNFFDDIRANGQITVQKYDYTAKMQNTWFISSKISVEASQILRFSNTTPLPPFKKDEKTIFGVDKIVKMFAKNSDLEYFFPLKTLPRTSTMNHIVLLK